MSSPKRERRGLTQPELPKDAFADFSRLNARIAKGDASDKTRRSAALAEAAWMIGLAREERT